MRHKEYYDGQRKPYSNLQSGDMVWLLPRNIRTTRPCKMLDYKKIGPFKILARIGTSAYKLDLLASMRIHNTFHISLLELYNDNKLHAQRSEPPPPILIEGEPEYKLEEIIDSHLHYNKLQYRAKWTRYSSEHDKTSYPADNFENANLAKRNFPSRYPNKPHLDKARGTGQRRHTSLRLASTGPGSNTSSTKKYANPTGELGNTSRLARNDADKSVIPLTFSLGGSGTKAKRTRCTPLDGVLPRQLLGTRQRESGTRMVPQEIQCYAFRPEPAIPNEGTSTRRGPHGPNINKPATKKEAFNQKLGGMLQRQVPSTRTIQGGRRILPTKRRDEERPLALAPVPPVPKILRRKERRRRDTTAERGERKNTTRSRGLKQTDPGSVKQKGAIPKKRGPLPKEARRPTGQDRATPRGSPRPSQNGGSIGIQTRKVEKGSGRGEERKLGARAQQSRASKGVEKSWAKVARLGQLGLRDRC